MEPPNVTKMSPDQKRLILARLTRSTGYVYIKLFIEWAKCHVCDKNNNKIRICCC